jgi:hypothetical protein
MVPRFMQKSKMSHLKMFSTRESPTFTIKMRFLKAENLLESLRVILCIPLTLVPELLAILIELYKLRLSVEVRVVKRVAVAHGHRQIVLTLILDFLKLILLLFLVDR